MTEFRKKLLANLISGLLIAVIVIFFRYDAEKGLIHQLCDGCFVAGVMLLGFGGLKFARNAGTFDMMAYGIDSALRVTLPWVMKEKKDADFVAYKERKQETRKPAKPEVVSGLIFLALSLVLLILYLVAA